MSVGIFIFVLVLLLGNRSNSQLAQASQSQRDPVKSGSGVSPIPLDRTRVSKPDSISSGSKDTAFVSPNKEPKIPTPTSELKKPTPVEPFAPLKKEPSNPIITPTDLPIDSGTGLKKDTVVEPPKKEPKTIAIVKPIRGTTVIIAENSIAYDLYVNPDISELAKSQLVEIGRVQIIKSEIRGEFIKKKGEFTFFRAEDLSPKYKDWVVSNRHVTVITEP